MLAAALVALAAWVVSGQSSELSGAGNLLGHLEWGWVLIAVAAEATSYLASAQLQRLLLRGGSVRASTGRTTLISLATNAMQNSLPAGAAFAGVFAFRQYRKMGADDVLATWVVVALTGVLFVGLTGLAVVGLVLAFGTGSALHLVQVLGGLAATAALLVLAWYRRRWLIDRTPGLLRIVQHVTGRPRGDVREIVTRIRLRLSAVTPSRRQWAGAFVAGVGTWGFDLLCLMFGFVAVGAPIPWRGLLLAYTAAQLAATLPITPGGLGVVEGSLTVALVAFGGAEASTVAAVLIYRVISYWCEIPVGWVSSVALTRIHARTVARQAILPKVVGGEAA